MLTDKPKARQSQLVTTYGVGALFPAGDQSFMVCGIDEWDPKWSAPIEEPRLASSLGVSVFRSPPSGRRSGDVPVVRFPTYHYCPECRRLAPFWTFDSTRMRCAECERDLTPSRFVACCENGHIEDFPYFNWVHRGSAGAAGEHVLRLRSSGASSSLADVVIACSCGVPPYNMDGSFARFALRDIKRCAGKRPWLPGAPDEVCDKPLRVLQRGSSNVWFSRVRSAISIPPWSSPDAKFVTKHWDVLQHLTEPAVSQVLGSMLTAASPSAGLSLEGLLRVIGQRSGLAQRAEATDEELRQEEYRALVDGHEGGPLDSFRAERVEVDVRLRPLVMQVSKVTRLREVRALEGFTRVTAAATETASPQMARLSQEQLDWLPATEVIGEGVFIQLQESAVAAWEASQLAGERQSKIGEAFALRAAEYGGDPDNAPSARFLGIHALAHALLVELSLDAGYPVGSLRERIYAGPGQAGMLIYTASSDAAGSLGGLAALAEPGALADSLIGAAGRCSWCSNDPVCAESGPSGTDGLNLAACHACLLLPETSCEHRNTYLDRVGLIGANPGDRQGLLAFVLGT